MNNRRMLQEECPVKVSAGEVTLDGDLCIPENATALVAFAHGSGSSRLSPRNRYVARFLRQGGLATLLFDLLTADEEAEDIVTARLRFDINLLARRLVATTDWLAQNEPTAKLKLGYFGSSTGAAAALVAAAQRPDAVGAVVSRGGRPDLAGPVLPMVKAATLLIVGGDDAPVIEMNREALDKLQTEKEIVIIPGATHLFEEPGALEQVSGFARNWFIKYLTGTYQQSSKTM